LFTSGDSEQVRLVGPSTPATKRDFTGQTCAFNVQLVDQRFHAVVGLGHLSGVESVGLENVGAGVQVFFLDRADDIGAGQNQQVVVALDVAWPVGETFAAIVFFLQAIALDHGAHTAIENQDPLFESLLECFKTRAAI
jgi:hypothetical protein